MNIVKLCKVYIGIGILVTGLGVASFKRKNPEIYNKYSTNAKILASIKMTLTWPDPFITGALKGIMDGYKEWKESTNESDT